MKERPSPAPWRRRQANAFRLALDYDLYGGQTRLGVRCLPLRACTQQTIQIAFGADCMPLRE